MVMQPDSQQCSRKQARNAGRAWHDRRMQTCGNHFVLSHAHLIETSCCKGVTRVNTQGGVQRALRESCIDLCTLKALNLPVDVWSGGYRVLALFHPRTTTASDLPCMPWRRCSDARVGWRRECRCCTGHVTGATRLSSRLVRAAGLWWLLPHGGARRLRPWVGSPGVSAECVCPTRCNRQPHNIRCRQSVDRNVPQVLLDACADINATADDHSNCLQCATMCDHVSVVALLLSRGADASNKDVDGLTAPQLASSAECTALFQ
eukprot:m.1388119 g.1388119  ORF g.1388119 m.1388119 type:complete len:262 (-) comp24987_c0_seq2:2993-3778(-)